MYYDELYHHGILGMKWGVRRYQNKDGSLTPEGARHYAKKIAKNNELIRAHALNRQQYANYAAGEAKRLMEAYGDKNNEKYRSGRDPIEQKRDIRKVRVQGEYGSYWKQREHESDQSMLYAEKRYDDYAAKLLKKFGSTGMEQIRAAKTEDLYEKSEKYLKDQTSLRKVYEELQKSMDEIENEYYNRLSDEEKKKLMYR